MLFVEKESYLIKAFGTTTIQVQTLKGEGLIKLTNVALASRFLTNLVLLRLLNVKRVYWNLENLLQTTCNSNTFCYLSTIRNY